MTATFFSAIAFLSSATLMVGYSSAREMPAKARVAARRVMRNFFMMLSIGWCVWFVQARPATVPCGDGCGASRCQRRRGDELFSGNAELGWPPGSTGKGVERDIIVAGVGKRAN